MGRCLGCELHSSPWPATMHLCLHVSNYFCHSTNFCRNLGPVGSQDDHQRGAEIAVLRPRGHLNKNGYVPMRVISQDVATTNVSIKSKLLPRVSIQCVALLNASRVSGARDLAAATGLVPSGQGWIISGLRVGLPAHIKSWTQLKKNADHDPYQFSG